MARIALKAGQDVEIGETAAYAITTEDGLASTWDYYVCLTTPTSRDCREMIHFKRFHRGNRLGAEELAATIRAAGTIDPQYWVEAEERDTLEERFAQYAEEEAWDRYQHTGRFFG